MRYKGKLVAFLKDVFLDDVFESAQNTDVYVKNMYFKNPHGCVSDLYLGDDLMNDIKTKFYFLLAFYQMAIYK
jgi:hypothetical protein